MNLIIQTIIGSEAELNTQGRLNAQTRDSVPWAAPDEIAYDPKKPLPALGLTGAGTFLATFADGSVRGLKTTIKPQTLHLLIQKADGQTLPDDFDK